MRTVGTALVLSFVLAVLPVAAQSTPIDERERREVLAVTQRLFTAMRAKDTSAMRSVFHSSARLVGMRPAAGGATRMQVLTADEFIAFVGRDPRPDWNERVWEPEVRIAGTLAAVWAPYDFHFGTTFSHCGIDAIHLLKTADGWRITALADTYQNAGCPSRPAPASPRPLEARDLRTPDVLAALPDDEDKREFILDCTGCHQMDWARVFPGGQRRSDSSWSATVERMLSFAGATTGFPVIGSGRHAGTTAAWLGRSYGDPAAIGPHRVLGSADFDSATVREYLLDQANDLPHDVAIDSAGRVVVTGMMSHRMLVLDTATGRWTNIDIPVPQANPRALDVDGAGRWWIALGRPQRIARYAPDALVDRWTVFDAGMYAHSVSSAPDGSVWLNGHFTREPALIASVDTLSASVRTVALPAHPTLSADPGGPIPYELRVARDGTVWTSELQGNRLIGFHPGTKMRQVIDMPRPHMGPRRFDVDASGVLWVPAYAANALLRIDPKATGAARIQEYPVPVSNMLPYVVRMSPGDSTLWIGTGAGGGVLRFDVRSRRFTFIPLPSPGALVRHLTVHPRTGEVWLAYGASPGIAARIARVTVRR